MDDTTEREIAAALAWQRNYIAGAIQTRLALQATSGERWNELTRLSIDLEQGKLISFYPTFPTPENRFAELQELGTPDEADRARALTEPKDPPGFLRPGPGRRFWDNVISIKGGSLYD